LIFSNVFFTTKKDMDGFQPFRPFIRGVFEVSLFMRECYLDSFCLECAW
jgi:hypothetical protein